MTAPTNDLLAQEFVQFSVEAGVLRFGDFKTKAGRQSPYFFNTGFFDDGMKLMRLGEFYARRLLASGVEFDMLFGPAYKGITLAAAVAIGLAKHGKNVTYAYNRKEAKDHGEGGTLVGAPVKGRVMIIDDVITDGASKREAADLIRAVGAEPVGVAITMDRQERGQGTQSAVQEVSAQFELRCVSILTLADLIETFSIGSAGDAVRISREQFAALQAYQRTWGIGAVSPGG